MRLKWFSWKLRNNNFKKVSSATITASYITSHFPLAPANRQQFASGGEVKLTYLSEGIPHDTLHPSALYAVSSVQHTCMLDILDFYEKRCVKFVLNQNGLYYQGWFGKGWERKNDYFRFLHNKASHIVFQSEFCRICVQELMGSIVAPHSVLYNPVDLDFYETSIAKRKNFQDDPVILTAAVRASNLNRIISALDSLRLIKEVYLNAKLLIAGYSDNNIHDKKLMLRILEEATKRNIANDSVAFYARYVRSEAPSLFAKAHILYHPVYNDASPNFVVEAVAAGLPVVHSLSGGTAEIVGSLAGKGIFVPQSFDKQYLPDTIAMAEATISILKNWQVYSQEARKQAVLKFSLENFINKHKSLFLALRN